MLTSFFEGPPLGNLFLKISPLSRNSCIAERRRPGREEVLWTCIENISPANHINCISLVYGNIVHCVAGPRTTVTLIILHLMWLPRLTWGEKCSKIPWVQIMYYEMGIPFRRANLLYRLPHSFSSRGRGSKIGVWPSSAQNSLPEPRRSASKKAHILKMLTSRRRYVQIPGNSVSVSLR